MVRQTVTQREQRRWRHRVPPAALYPPHDPRVASLSRRGLDETDSPAVKGHNICKVSHNGTAAHGAGSKSVRHLQRDNGTLAGGRSLPVRGGMGVDSIVSVSDGDAQLAAPGGGRGGVADNEADTTPSVDDARELELI